MILMKIRNKTFNMIFMFSLNKLRRKKKGRRRREGRKKSKRDISIVFQLLHNFQQPTDSALVDSHGCGDLLLGHSLTAQQAALIEIRGFVPLGAPGLSGIALLGGAAA